MYCSQCGKKVLESMLFCPFCGSPIIIPDQDDKETGAAVMPAMESSQAAEDFQKDSFDIREEALFAMPEIEKAEIAEEIIPEIFESVDEDKHEDPIEPVDTAEEDDAPSEESISEGEPEADPTEDDSAVKETAFRSLFDDSEEEESGEEVREVFIPLSLEEEEPEAQWEKITPEMEKKPPEMRRREENPVRLEGHAPRLDSQKEKDGEKKGKNPPARRNAATYVPPRPLNPEDMFMDNIDDEDNFDILDEDFEEEEDVYAFEDDDEGNFFMRHIRGLIGLTLLLILALVFVFYGISDKGQETLAQMNLAWKPEAYSKLAMEYYHEEQYDLAGGFYEKALARDPENYRYAESAATVYLADKNNEKAAMMLKKCIEINPSKAEPYVYLMNIYPDSTTRPWDISQLLLQGYRTTGDERLKSVAQ